MAAPTQAPAALGFRMPAEWERQEAVWLSWPHNRGTWPGNFRPIPGVFAAVAAQVSLREKVRINIAPALQKRALSLIRAARADTGNVEFYSHPTNDAWCRDHGPIFVRNDRTGEVAVTDWDFNSWGGKYPPFGLDNRIPGRIARAPCKSFNRPRNRRRWPRAPSAPAPDRVRKPSMSTAARWRAWSEARGPGDGSQSC